jgi:hypothetical protein
MSGLGVERSVEVDEAVWIAERLAPFGSGVTTSVVPGGFEMYARVLHPLGAAAHGGQPVRWADVAAWSGVALVPGIDFPEVAMPEHEPAGQPWPEGVPDVGTLDPSDVVALSGELAGHTATPDRCWFCTWEGWGAISFADGPRVELPARTYVLSVGALAALPSLMAAQDDYSPNLWWPDDRAWCVATEIDLAWTYVGGTAALINKVLANSGLEAQPASPDESHYQRPPSWLEPAIEDAATELISSGAATLGTWRGTLHAHLERPQQQTDGNLRIQRTKRDGHGGSSWTRITEHDPNRLRSIVADSLTWAVIDLL